jgi:hypothetical protein
MPLLFNNKFFLMIIVISVITFVATISATITAVAGQNQISNLTALSTPRTNNTMMTITNNTVTNMSTTATDVIAIDNMTIEDVKNLYLLIWNQTEFNVTFNTFIEPFSATGYGVYEERDTVFVPGETIVFYLEPVGFAHEKVLNEESSNNTRYLINMTADYEISAANGTMLQSIEDVQVGSITSHRPNTELFLTLTLSQEVLPFPVGSYVIAYSVTDEISGESFQLEKEITVVERRVSSSNA